MIPQAHFMAVVVRAFLIGCAVLLLVVGCAGPSSETSNKKKEQGSSPQATESEQARCEGTRTYHRYIVVYPNLQNGPLRTGSEEDMRKADKKARQHGNKVRDLGLETTNDLPGCPKGGLLKGTDSADRLAGLDGDDEIRGLGGSDIYLEGGDGNDILYGGKGEDDIYGGDGEDDIYGGKGEDVIYGGDGEDVIYGGDGNDTLILNKDGQRDKLYCGKGKDRYIAEKNDYVDSSCEKKLPPYYFVA